MEVVVEAIRDFSMQEAVGNVWYVTLILTCFDVVTGVLAAAKERKLNSSINYYGMIRKVGLFVLLALCVFLDELFGANNKIAIGAVALISLYEGMSIVENFARIGIDASFLTQYFEGFKVGRKETKKKEGEKE